MDLGVVYFFLVGVFGGVFWIDVVDDDVFYY